MSKWLKIRNWDEWQSYRSDRGQPPWIKVHRCVMRNPDWVALTDAQRGQLVAMWLLAADRDGVIPASPELIQKLCFLDSEPDLQVFMSHGFIEPDDTVASKRRQSDDKATAQSALARGRGREEAETESHTHRARDDLEKWLGEYATVIEGCRPVEDDQARRTLYEQYGPPGLRANAWKQEDGSAVPNSERPRLLALAVSGYAGEGNNRIITAEFAGMLRRVIRDESDSPEKATEGATGFIAYDSDYEPGGIYYTGSADA